MGNRDKSADGVSKIGSIKGRPKSMISQINGPGRMQQRLASID